MVDAIGNGTDSAESLGKPSETDALEVAAKTLAGDLRDGIWRVLQDYGVLLKRDEAAQRRLSEAIATQTGALVSRAVSLIAGRDFPTISVALEQVTFKPKGIETKMTMSGLDRARRHELVDAQNKVILLVIADPSAFLGARSPVKVDGEDKPAAEPELPLAGDSLDKIETDAAAIAGRQTGGVASEAFEVGRADALLGHRDNAGKRRDKFGGVDYELGHQEGERERNDPLGLASAEANLADLQQRVVTRRRGRAAEPAP